MKRNGPFRHISRCIGAMSHPDKHRVSVVIPTMGRPQIVSCREGLARQTRQADEIIEVLDLAKQGVAWGRNEGIRRSSGDLIAFVDDDAIPPPDWLERLVSALDRNRAAVAGGTFEETDPFLREVRNLREWPDDERIDTEGHVGNGGNIMFRREWLDRLKEIDGCVYREEWRNASEDWELIWRLRSLGATLVYVPVRVTHLRRAGLRAHLHHQYVRGKGIAQLYRALWESREKPMIQKSLLWQDGMVGSLSGILLAGWFTLIGPFKLGAFSSYSHFAKYWLGEKSRAAGFLHGLLLRG
jgi:glycosyltransferase involved in cell wall biosynthesis